MTWALAYEEHDTSTRTQRGYPKGEFEEYLVLIGRSVSRMKPTPGNIVCESRSTRSIMAKLDQGHEGKEAEVFSMQSV